MTLDEREPHTTATDNRHHATITTILEANTSYHVRVRATSPESHGSQWCRRSPHGRSWGPARPTRRATTARPSTIGTDSLGANVRSVDENTPAGENVGSPVTAAPTRDTTTLTYRSRRSPRRPVQLRHSVRADTDEGPPESRGPAVRLQHRSGSDQTSCYLQGDGDSYRWRWRGRKRRDKESTLNGRVHKARAFACAGTARRSVLATEKWSTRLDISWNAPGEYRGPQSPTMRCSTAKGSTELLSQTITASRQ